jgi:hypothetical protein
MKPTGVTLSAVLFFSLATPAHSAETQMAVRVGDQTVYWSQHRAKHWENEHRNWTQRGGYVALRVSDEEFPRYFGPEHTFLLSDLPFRKVAGVAEVQVNGYWMRVVDPWPESWPDGWSCHDPVHVSPGDGGYYLYNRYYPKTALALEFITR